VMIGSSSGNLSGGGNNSSTSTASTSVGVPLAPTLEQVSVEGIYI
jgi:hypothetical protein